MKEKLLYLMLILFVSASVFAQTGGGSAAFTIKGQVVDSLSNESVPYATLRIAWLLPRGMSDDTIVMGLLFF